MKVGGTEWSEKAVSSTEAFDAAAADRTWTTRPRQRHTRETPEREADNQEFLKGAEEARVDVFMGFIGTGFNMETEGACYAEGVVTMQGLTGLGNAYLLGAMGPEMLKSPRRATRDHCDGIQAAGSSDDGHLPAAVAERIVPYAMMMTSRLGLGAARQLPLTKRASAPSHA